MLSMTQATFGDWPEEPRNGRDENDWVTFGDWPEEPRNGRDENDWVLLRVGGQEFETSRLTLCTNRESKLAALVLRHRRDSNSIIRIDRDGQRFAHVLNYLRNGTVWLQDTGLLRELQEEAGYYGLAGLSALCEEKIQLIGEAQEAASRKNVEILKEELKKWVGDVIPVRFSGGGEVFSAREQPPEFRLGEDF